MDTEHMFVFIAIILAVVCTLLFWNVFTLGLMGERIRSIDTRDKEHLENSKKFYSCLEQIASSLENLEETALEVRQLALLTEDQLNREGNFYDKEDEDDSEGPLQ